MIDFAIDESGCSSTQLDEQGCTLIPNDSGLYTLILEIQQHRLYHTRNTCKIKLCHQHGKITLQKNNALSAWAKNQTYYKKNYLKSTPYYIIIYSPVVWRTDIPLLWPAVNSFLRYSDPSLQEYFGFLVDVLFWFQGQTP